MFVVPILLILGYVIAGGVLFVFCERVDVLKWFRKRPRVLDGPGVRGPDDVVVNISEEADV